MIDDVRLAVGKHLPIEFYGRTGGVVPMPEEILEAIHTLEQVARPGRKGILRSLARRSNDLVHLNGHGG
jgi:hypothetical protein